MGTLRHGMGRGRRWRPLPAHPAWRPVLLSVLAGTVMLRGHQAMAGSFEPGAEPEPPTGSAPVQAVPRPDPDGIQWVFAPLTYSGSLSVDGRWQRTDPGLGSRQGLMVGDIEFATHVWQPWFVQLRFGLGMVVAHETVHEAGQPDRSTSQPSQTGRLQLSVFPMSRFPFELRAEVGDSRVQGDTPGADYRTRRLTLNQAYSPADGAGHYSLLFDHGRRQTDDGVEDTLTHLSAMGTRQWTQHTLDASAQQVVNHRTDTGDRTRNSAISLHHHHRPSASFQTDSLASWNRSGFESGGGPDLADSSTELRQLSTFASWQPGPGEWLHEPGAPLHITGSARLAQGEQVDDGGTHDQQAVNLSLGATKDLTPAWRLNGSTGATLMRVGGLDREHFVTANMGVAYMPPSIELGAWRYAPSADVNFGTSRSSREGRRHNVGAQAGHALSRSYALDENDSLSLSLSQSVGAQRETPGDEWSRQLVHASSVSWQGYGSEASQSYAALSFSDARSFDRGRGSFQLLNLQVSRRTQVSRDASWSGNLTAQGSRSTTASAEPAFGLDSSARQRFYSGSLSYEHRRAFGVPRLRFTAQLILNSQQLESRTLGDMDAPRELITQSVEGRFDYTIGRLNTQLTSRWVEADGRGIASVFFRVQRHF